MAINFPGPNVLEVRYAVDGVQHKMNLNCDIEGIQLPGDDFSSLMVNTRGGNSVNLETALNSYLDLIRVFWSTGCDFIEVIVWEYLANTNDRVFITAASLDKSGSNVGATVLAQQQTLTFRSVEGGIMKLVFLETADPSRQRIPFSAYAPGNITVLRDFITGTDNWIKAKDTSFPVAALNVSSGGNEKIFRKRFRQ